MYTKEMTYTDYNGNQRTEKFYFNLTKAELMELDLAINGGFEAYIQQIVEAQDSAELVKQFKKIILMSYGEKSLDGRTFNKSPELSNAFMQTPAYSDLFIELATNSDSAVDFINGIVPDDMATEDADKAIAAYRETGTLPSMS